MKTTIDIPQEELEEAMRWTGARTRREAVVSAIMDFNRRQCLQQLAGELGSFEGVLSSEELSQLRDSE